ncbi:MAG: SAM-dependent chlorinase/fluorinase [Nitrospiraceae bacterium]|nr:SAM-dependent chlorinase/fluorinase [Nitrospiraceae bacterium]
MRLSEVSKHRTVQKPSGIVTLTTDFGHSDCFAAEMKGVILSISPDSRLVDVTHHIERHAVRHAAIVIDSASAYFPKGTVHVVVVDPGVGSSRRPIAIKAGGSYFIGPDNGVFSKILARTARPALHQITNKKYVLTFDSSTFYGRDVFGPVAAHLANGLDIKELGKRITDPIMIDFNAPFEDNGVISGEIEYVDGFGNAISNIKCKGCEFFETISAVLVDDIPVVPMKCYAEAEEGSLSCLVNSSGCLEFFVNQYSAAKMFDLRIGSVVKLIKK